MTSTHTMRLPVRAWQVGPDGSLPEGAEGTLAPVSDNPRDPDLIWSDVGGGVIRFVRLGDWIVASDFGVHIYSDAEFREWCDPT